MRKIYGNLKDASDLLKTSEMKTQYKIFIQSHNLYNKNLAKTRFNLMQKKKTISFSELAEKDKTVNPFLTMFYHKVTFKRWVAVTKQNTNDSLSEDSDFEYLESIYESMSDESISSESNNTDQGERKDVVHIPIQ